MCFFGAVTWPGAVTHIRPGPPQKKAEMARINSVMAPTDGEVEAEQRAIDYYVAGADDAVPIEVRRRAVVIMRFVMLMHKDGGWTHSNIYWVTLARHAAGLSEADAWKCVDIARQLGAS